MRGITFTVLCVVGMMQNICLAGERPYEMVLAGRTKDDHPALEAFTDPSGWKVKTKNAVASFTRSQDVLLFGDAVSKLTYRANGENPEIELIPPKPLTISKAFDAVTCWIYGNNHSYWPRKDTPPVSVYVNFADSQGKPFAVYLIHVHHKEWFLCHKRLNPEQIERVKNGAKITGITIKGGRNTEDRVLYFNSLAVFTEEFAPLKLSVRPKRGYALFPDQPQGMNTGSGKLPFPNTPLTVIPKDPVPSEVLIGKGDSGHFYMTRKGKDGTLEIRLPKEAGNWDTMAFRWNKSQWYPFGQKGGIWFAPDATRAQKYRAPNERFTQTTDGKVVQYVGSFWDGSNRLSNAELHFRLIGKSLAIDLKADGGAIEEICFGSYKNLTKADLIPIPYYTFQLGDMTKRPGIVSTEINGKPFFFSSTMDWTQSNASTPFVKDGSIGCNGGVIYRKKTDGKRNPCFERFVYTFSPVFDQALPNIPNPVSPWKHITGTRVWRAHGAGNRKNDAAMWRNVRRWGMKNITITDHESGWRDGNESFTFRTMPAPKKGGDKGQYDYARILQDELGFVYGPYNNFTDFAPVNQYWSFDMITREPDKQLLHAWERCYAPKPSKAVEFCEKLAPIIESKFHFSTAYCDVHTAVTPWGRCDYDSRVPGGGTFAATYYAFGEIMLLQKAAWDGPVYSEGGCHFPYVGLTDGNYAQDQNYNIADNPWLVDFDLLRMHPLCCNFGMGNPDMFYPRETRPKDPQLEADRFLAATIAFGHPGFLLYRWSQQLQSYYMIQPIAAYYTQADAAEIRYADLNGNLMDTSTAIAKRIHARSQVRTRYTDGTVTYANGNRKEPFVITWEGKKQLLPPNGFCGKSGDGKVLVWSGEVNGHRADYSRSPDAFYLNGRGQFARFPDGACDGTLIRLPEGANTEEILLHEAKEAALPYPVEKLFALNNDRKESGDVPFRIIRGWTYFKPEGGVFSYRAVRSASSKTGISSPDFLVDPGQKVTLTGSAEKDAIIPKDAKPGAHVWVGKGADAIDFVVYRKSELKVQEFRPTTLPMPLLFINGMARRGGKETEIEAGCGASVSPQWNTCGKVKRKGFFFHPPYLTGHTGYVFLKQRLDLPKQACSFSCQAGRIDGSDLGDGHLFKFFVEDDKGRHLMKEIHIARHEWKPISFDLSPWKGKAIHLIIIEDPGVKDNTSGDWGAIGDMQIKLTDQK